MDELVEQWRRQRPDIDAEPMALIGRLGRLSYLIGRVVEAGLATHGLSRGEFDVLAALRRAGPPFRLSPTAMVGQLLLSPSAMTHRIDRLEKAGLVRREPDPRDRRAQLVSLTAGGLDRVDAAVTAHAENERRLLDGLTSAEQRRLSDLLRKLLLTLPPSTL